MLNPRSVYDLQKIIQKSIRRDLRKLTSDTVDVKISLAGKRKIVGGSFGGFSELSVPSSGGGVVPPEPEPGNVFLILKTGFWNDTEIWNDQGIWNET